QRCPAAGAGEGAGTVPADDIETPFGEVHLIAGALVGGQGTAQPYFYFLRATQGAGGFGGHLHCLIRPPGPFHQGVAVVEPAGAKRLRRLARSGGWFHVVSVW